MVLNLEQRGRVWILAPQRSLFGGAETDELDRELEDRLHHQERFVVIDCSKVQQININGIDTLGAYFPRYPLAGGRIVLAAVNLRVRQHLAVAGFDFDHYATVDEAAAAINPEEP